jgi:hypothetical protein
MSEKALAGLLALAFASALVGVLLLILLVTSAKRADEKPAHEHERTESRRPPTYGQPPTHAATSITTPTLGNRRRNHLLADPINQVQFDVRCGLW